MSLSERTLSERQRVGRKDRKFREECLECGEFPSTEKLQQSLPKIKITLVTEGENVEMTQQLSGLSASSVLTSRAQI